MERVEREAAAFNEKPFVLPYFPPGQGKKAAPAIALVGSAIILAAMKKSEDGNDLILRLFEPTGTSREADLALPFASSRTRLVFAPFEIKTIRFHPKSGRFREVDLLEKPVKA